MPDTDVQTNPAFDKMLKQMGVTANPEGEDRLKKDEENIEHVADPIKSDSFRNPPDRRDYKSDPLNALSSTSAWLAMFGGLLTKHPLESSLTSAASAMQAANTGNEKAYKSAVDNWKENNTLILDRQKFLLDAYKAAKSEDQIANLAKIYGDPSAENLARMGMANSIHLPALEKMITGFEKHSNDAIQTVNEKMEKAAYVRDSMEQWQKDNPKATKIEQDQERLRLQSEAASIIKGDTGSTSSAVDWDSLKPSDKVPGTGVTYATLKQKAEGLHSGASYSDVGISMRTTKNAEKDAVDDLRAHLYPDDNIVSSKLGYAGEKAEETTLGHQTAKLRTAGEEFDRLADLALASSEKVSRSDYPSLNKAIEAVDAGTGDTNVVALVTNARGAVNTWARAINPNGVATVEATTAGTHLLDVAYSKGQFAEALKQMKAETKAAREAPAAVEKDIQEQVNPKKKTPNKEAIKHLKEHPELKSDFDEYYGKGSANKYLGAQ